MQMLQESWKSADSLKKDDLDTLRKLTNYKKGSEVVKHVLWEEERSRLPDALRDAPSFASQYAFSMNQVAEKKMTTGEQADLDVLLNATLAHVLPTDQTFAAEKFEVDRLLLHWRLYDVDVFRSTYGRAPVLYDFVCGQRTVTQAAALAGCHVVGFDRLSPSRHFGNLPGSRPGLMHFIRMQMPNVAHVQVDLDCTRRFGPV
eukprot:5760107-Pleurochrysis_carterae.AAC.2